MTSQHVPVRKQDEQVLSDDTSMFKLTKSIVTLSGDLI